MRNDFKDAIRRDLLFEKQDIEQELTDMVLDKQIEVQSWSEERVLSFLNHRDGLTRGVIRKELKRRGIYIA